MQETREQIKKYILGRIDEGDKDFVKKAVEYFGKSKSTVYNYISELLVVWQKMHPQINVTVLNAEESVDFMIRRAVNTKPMN